MKYAVRLSNQVIWTQGGKEILYDTEDEAYQAIEDEAEECARACELGYMEDEGDFSDYRVVKAK